MRDRWPKASSTVFRAELAQQGKVGGRPHRCAPTQFETLSLYSEGGERYNAASRVLPSRASENQMGKLEGF